MKVNRFLLSLLFMSSIGAAQAQTVTVQQGSDSPSFTDQFCSAEQVEVLFTDDGVTFTPTYYGSEQTSAAKSYKSNLNLTFDSQAVEPVQLRNPSGRAKSYNVGSFVCSNNIDLTLSPYYSDSEIHGYVATDNTTNAITLAQQDVFGRNQAFVLRANAQGWFCLPVTTASVSSEYNYFQGSASEAVSLTGITGDVYALSSAGTFKKVNKSVSIPARKAYYCWTASAAKGIDELELDFNGAATNISDINAETTSDAPAYNLAGQRVSQSAKGVIIVNGKKNVKR